MMVRLILIAAAAALAWWLSGYDSRLTGENKRDDLVRRGWRCAWTLVFLAFGWLVPPLIIFMFVAIAVLWASCVSELFARGFHVFVDHPDDREFDPKQATRELDRLTTLVRAGRNEEAMKLSRDLLAVPGVSAATVETLLFGLYHEQFGDHRIVRIASLAEAMRLRSERHFEEAIAWLESLLKKDPANLGAALLLMQIHTQDLAHPDRALALIHSLERERHLPPGFADYARRCIGAWSGAAPVVAKTKEGIESLLVDRPATTPQPAVNVHSASVDELLAAGHLATAIEILEQRIRTQPDDFASWLKLAEAHGAYRRHPGRAAKIVAQIGNNPAFTPGQIELAKARLREWSGRNSVPA